MTLCVALGFVTECKLLIPHALRPLHAHIQALTCKNHSTKGGERRQKAQAMSMTVVTQKAMIDIEIAHVYIYIYIYIYMVSQATCLSRCREPRDDTRRGFEQKYNII
jgi:hypothetical protein